jgi:hypothetical protein
MTALFEFGRAQGRRGGGGNMFRQTYIVEKFSAATHLPSIPLKLLRTAAWAESCTPVSDF